MRSEYGDRQAAVARVGTRADARMPLLLLRTVLVSFVAGAT
jgi:hypothetical protein